MIAVVKVISIADGVYAELSRVKGERSFSQVILTLLKKQSVDGRAAALGLFGKKDLVDERKLRALEGEWRKWSEKYA